MLVGSGGKSRAGCEVVHVMMMQTSIAELRAQAVYGGYSPRMITSTKVIRRGIVSRVEKAAELEESAPVSVFGLGPLRHGTARWYGTTR